MIYIGLGGNLPFENLSAQATLRAALACMPNYGVTPNKISPFYHSQPVPVSDQPWFINAVAACETTHAPSELLRIMLHIEEKFGRVRSIKNAARTLDLDILDYHGKIISEFNLALPHPNLASRAFVLLPLGDIAPDWQHPLTGKKIGAMIAELHEDARMNISRMSS